MPKRDTVNRSGDNLAHLRTQLGMGFKIENTSFFHIYVGRQNFHFLIVVCDSCTATEITLYAIAAAQVLLYGESVIARNQHQKFKFLNAVFC